MGRSSCRMGCSILNQLLLTGIVRAMGKQSEGSLRMKLHLDVDVAVPSRSCSDVRGRAVRCESETNTRKEEVCVGGIEKMYLWMHLKEETVVTYHKID